MGIKGISLGETKDFTSIYDKEEPKTKWIIGALDSDIFDLVVGQENQLKIASEAVRFGLKGFENFNDSNNKPLKFDTVSRAVGPYNYKVISDNIMKLLPPQVKIELAAEILKISKLNEEEIKNS